MPATISRMPPRLPVAQIAAAAQALIDLLDATGGDVNREDDDPAEHDGTDQGDPAWTEFHTRGRHKFTNVIDTRNGEDAEDDDPAEPIGDELDGDRAEDEAGAELYACFESVPGCPITDPDVAVDDHRCDPDEGAPIEDRRG